MSEWSVGYYEAVAQHTAGKPQASRRDIMDYVTAGVLKGVIRSAMDENKRIQGSNTVGGRFSGRLDEILTLLKFDSLKNRSLDYWKGYFNGINDSTAISHEESLFIAESVYEYHKSQLLSSINGMIANTQRQINGYKKKLKENPDSHFSKDEIVKLGNTIKGLEFLQKCLSESNFENSEDTINNFVK